MFEEELVDSGSKPFYSHLRSKMTIAIGILGAIRDEHGLLHHDQQTISNVLAKQYMKTSVSKPVGPVPPVTGISRVTESLSEVEFSIQEVEQLLESVQLDTTFGPDKINP